MRVLVGLNTRNILDYLNYANSFIIGLKDFSINYQEYSVMEIEKLREDYPNIEIFVSINKNIFNSDLQELEEKLTELSNLNNQEYFLYLNLLKLAYLPSFSDSDTIAYFIDYCFILHVIF